MATQRYIASDGTPQYAIWAEQWLIGSALQAPRKFLPSLNPDDFHDRSLATIWQAILDTPDEPSLPAVADLLAARGALDEVGAEPRLAALLTHPYAVLYGGRAAMAAHADIVAEWGEKRRQIAALGEQAKAIHARPSNVTPIYERPEYQGGL